MPNSDYGISSEDLSSELTPTCFQPSSLPLGNMGAANSITTDGQGAGQMAFSGRYLPELKLKEFGGDPMEGTEWSRILQSTVGRSSLTNDEKMRHLKTLLAGAARRSIQGLGYCGYKFSDAWSSLE